MKQLICKLMGGKTAVFSLLLIFLLPACATTQPAKPQPPTPADQGQLAELEDLYGTFYAYVPANLPQNPNILVVVHGTPLKEETAEWNAHYYAENWTQFAEEQGLILLAPTFNQEDFSSRYGDHAMSGYRGLFGREIGADEWVLRLVEEFQETYGVTDERFYLYGHSAGGQFTARFLVTHPESLKKAVITAAATYPQPTTEVAWPFGLGELHTDVEWDEETIVHVDVVPDKATWLAATQVPLTVIVGLNDTAVLPEYLLPGQKGRIRYDIAKNWVHDMAIFAEEYGQQSQFELDIIPGKGHTMSGLMPYTQEALMTAKSSTN